MTDRFVYVCTKNTEDDPDTRLIEAKVSLIVSGRKYYFYCFPEDKYFPTRQCLVIVLPRGHFPNDIFLLLLWLWSYLTILTFYSNAIYLV